MKKLIFIAALLTSTAAHADDFDMQADMDDMMITMDMMQQQLWEAQHPNYRYAPLPPRKYWTDMLGNTHDCSYDRPWFGSQCDK
jgi:hypothetical protein